MNQLVKARWVEKLRSGDYRQGQRTMNRNDRFCCLGVLMEVAVEDGVVVRISSPNVVGEFCYIDASEDPEEKSAQYWSSPSTEARGWAELTDDATNKLIELNDEDRWPFSEIADWIEENL